MARVGVTPFRFASGGIERLDHFLLGNPVVQDQPPLAY
jgi:hypothetical protein